MINNIGEIPLSRNGKIRVLKKELFIGEKSGVSKRTLEEIWKKVKLSHK